MIVRVNRCENCKFFNLEGQPGQGECRRHPPKISAFLMPPSMPGGPPGSLNVTSFPVVALDAWCGEYLKGILNATD